MKDPLENTYLNGEAVREFDSIISGYRRKKRNLRLSLACAAVVAVTVPVIFFGAKSPATPDFSAVEILDTINTLANIGAEDINRINAKPQKDRIIITVSFKDGTKKTYHMRRADNDTSILLTAQN